jgi:hypothetical protein
LATIEIPDFEFSAFYYPEILQALTLYKRRNVPELTDESDFEPLMQLLKAFALVGHLNNVLLDLIANENTLPTARLPETVRNMLRLINYELSPATPSQVDLLYEINRVLTTSTVIVPGGAQAATRRGTADTVVVYFEALTGVTCERTDEYGAVFAEEVDGTFTDHTTVANAGTAFDVWSDSVAAGSKIYFGHATAMWDIVDLEVNTVGEITIGAWEFYDGDFNDTKPTDVTNLGGGQLQFDVSELLGTQKRLGATVRVTHTLTGTYEDVVSSWNGSLNVVTTGLLGQSSPSTSVNDYVVGVDWQEMASIIDNTSNLAETGKVTYTLPQDTVRNWTTTTVNGFEGYFIRFRVVEVSDVTTPNLGRARMDGTGTKQYVMTTGTQGRSVRNEALGSSNGEANQRFRMAQSHFVLESEEVYVSDVQWTRVDNFLSSTSQDTHYVVELGEDDRATVVFGNGVIGKIPPIGQGNLSIYYRHNAEVDGNVGSSTIVVDKTGLSAVSSITNPRQAVGWAEAQSASAESLERAKVEGPASLRLREVALGPDDLISLVLAYTNEAGAKPFVRAKVIEEGYGPKTMEVVLVAQGGGEPTSGQLTELTTYLNGDDTADPPLPKRIVANHEGVATSFEPLTFDIEAIVEAPSTVTQQQIVNHLSQVFQPMALKADGVTFLWSFGGKIPIGRVNHEIFSVDPLITDIELISPAVDTQLGSRELPVAGTIRITVVPQL